MKNVLIVDDSATVRQQVGSVLRDAGFGVVEAADGIEGAESIESRNDLAVVVCDINMPKMSGLEMLERVKGGGKNADLPIIMLTTESRPDLIERAKQLGAKGWVVKPFKAELFIKGLQKLVGSA